MKQDELIAVGKYAEAFNEATAQSLPCETIYQSVGLYKHILKRHPDEIGNIQYVPSIIKQPDYIGRNPKEQNSIELVKHIGDNLQVCIKLDTDDNYLYVASIYVISEGKLKNRINSGRLKVFLDNSSKV